MILIALGRDDFDSFRESVKVLDQYQEALGY